MAQFTGKPTPFADYLDWARKAGCKVTTGYVNDPVAGIVTFTLIEAPCGTKWIHEVGIEQHESLMPTTVWKLDRRLGLVSPFDSVDPNNPFC